MPDATEKMMRTVSRLPMGNRGPIPSIIRADADPSAWVEPDMLMALLHQARHAFTVANSYRDFNVGAAASVHKGPLRGIVVGANIKPEPETTVNVHAEQQVLRSAQDLGYRSVSMLVVVGETQNDQQSNQPMHTLHPCGLCRQMMRESSLIDNDRTVIVSALPDLQTLEISTVNKLIAYHDGGDKGGIDLVMLPPLKMFEPAATGGSVVRIHDSDALNDEERVWAEAIVPRLRQYRPDY